MRMVFDIKTRMIEAMVVFLVLASVAYLSGSTLEEWIVCFAILFTFMHAQVADRMKEKEDTKIIPDVSCYQRSTRYYVLKELLRVVFFLITQVYTALL